jgi:hypothetical protein
MAVKVTRWIVSRLICRYRVLGSKATSKDDHVQKKEIRVEKVEGTANLDGNRSLPSSIKTTKYGSQRSNCYPVSQCQWKRV